MTRRHWVSVFRFGCPLKVLDALLKVRDRGEAAHLPSWLLPLREPLRSPPGGAFNLFEAF